MAKQKNIPLLTQADQNQPSLNYAVALQILAAKVGFDWPDVQAVADKIKEELDEVLVEVPHPDNHERLQDEIGDLLFACTNLARHLNIDPEQALQDGNRKFTRRFNAIEHYITSQNNAFSEYTTAELNTLWQQIKSQE